MSYINKIHELGTKYDSDKITHHNYHGIYDFFLKSFYNDKGSLLEIGIDSGKSLQMWMELFPHAFVYGMDINVSAKSDRFNIIQGDQSNSIDLYKVKSNVGELFLINDDGSHIPEHQLLTFNILFPCLREGGIYILEDIETSYWTKGGLYGYQTRYGYKHPNSIVEIFKEVADSINSEFAGTHVNKVEHCDKIDSITFSKNCIIVVKKTQVRRDYRFSEFL